MASDLIICGREEKDIRQAYFKQKLPALLNEIQAEAKWEKAEIERLGAFLEGLRTEDDETLKSLQAVFGGKLVEAEPKPPTVQELVKEMTPEEQKRFEEWQANVQNSKSRINQIRTAANLAVIKKQPVKRDDWLDWALQIETLKRWLMEEAVYLEQLYRRELTRIKDSYGISRAEAEERAKITTQYRDYRNAADEVSSLTEIVLLCKKRAGLEM